MKSRSQLSAVSPRLLFRTMLTPLVITEGARKADAAAFATKYGKAHNAFGKCVASTAKTS